MFLDAEKAFNRVKWDFLLEQLKYMEVGRLFLDMISAIYFQQHTQFIVNEDLTEPLNIYRGTRKGCPLSPILFIMTLEPLLIQIRANKNIKGLKTG